MSIHPTSIVHSSAVVPSSCSIGPFCTIGPDVTLGEDCELISHVVLDGKLTAGARNRFFPFASVGAAPQDLKYRGELTGAVLGDDNVIRESVTISRGTVTGGGVTRVGSGCLIMTCAHVGHDSMIGDSCILANSAALAGHVLVEDYATVGALCAVHQFCRIGRYSFIGGGTVITQDVLPYSLTSAKREAGAYGANKVGLERRGFEPSRIRAIQHALRLFSAGKMNVAMAAERIHAEASESEDVAYLLKFVEGSSRGIIR